MLVRNLAVVVLLCAFQAPVMAQQFGRVTGRVVSTESRQSLEGARVTVPGTSLSAVTDASGHFLLPRVPAGDQTVQVAAIGRTPVTRRVTVRAEAAELADFELALAATQLSELKVIGARAMSQAEALTMQQSAPNIINVVASDQIGRFPDASAPEAVQRLPGVVLSRDQGEGRYISIRGAAPSGTQVTYNGVHIPSPESEVRQIALDAVPVDVLQSIEVSKALLPSMDADAIGGTVNLVTRRAPAAGVFSLEGAAGYASIREEAAGNGAVTWGNRSKDGRFGILLAGSYSRRNFGSDDVEPSWDDGDLEAMEARYYSLWRARTGGTANFDFRPSENTTFTLSGLYSRLQDTEQRRVLVHAVADEELVFEHRSRYEFDEILGGAFSGKHVLKRGAQIDYQFGATRSREKQPYETTLSFVQGGVTFAPDLSNPDAPQPNPQNNAINAGAYEFNEEENTSYDTRNRDLVGALNITLPYQMGGRATGQLKFGMKYRTKNKLQDLATTAAELNDETPLILGQGIGAAWNKALKYPVTYPLPPNATTDDEARDFSSNYASRLDEEEVLEEDTNNYDITEDVFAGYVMTELNLSPSFMLLPGVRFEQTRVDATGFDWDSEAETLTPTSATKDYGKVFPMVHLRYAMSPRTNLRAAFTTAMSRPNFFDLVPFRLRDDEDVTLGNPDLDPTTSRNFDLLLEHYDDRIGVLSAGAFYKDLSDPIFHFTEENEFGGDTEQPQNGQSGWIAGFELAAQKQLRFLPRPLDGLGIYANYTFTDSKATLPDGREARFQGQAKNVLNAAVSYELGGFSGQVSFSFIDNTVQEYGGEAAEDVVADSHQQWDVSASYRFGGKATVFFEMLNLGNEPFRVYEGDASRIVQAEYYQRWGRFGVRFTW